jgi:small GTP-binding protein
MSQNLFEYLKYPTVQGSSKLIKFERDGIIQNFVLHDTAGQEQYRSMIMQYVRSSNIVLLVFSITTTESFEEIAKLAQDIESQWPDISLIVIGNKIDLEENREVTQQEALKIGNEIGASYIETSALTGEGFDELFSVIGNELIAQKQRESTMNAPVVILEVGAKRNGQTCSC